MSFFSIERDMAIDIGTATSLVYIKDKGIILKEPSIVAIDRSNNSVVAVGEEARKMIGKTPGNIVTIHPLRDGVISDYDITEVMLKNFIKKVWGIKKRPAPRVVISVPCNATGVERRAVKDAAINGGAKKVYLIEEPMAAAIGAGLDISKTSGNFIIDIGAGTTDIAVISLGGMVLRDSIKVAGDKFDELIIDYIRKNHKTIIGEKTAEDIKVNIGSAYKKEKESSIEISGGDLINGIPKKIIVSSEEIREALKGAVNIIVERIHSVLQETTPELLVDIYDKGIIMTGGGALLNGLDVVIQEATKIPVYIAENAVSCVALGMGKVLDYLDKLDMTYGEDIIL
ncbi:rod shape-determining protein MreB [Clostridium pascui]|uniref:rod shape-determining protein n=1 Tax=Clostridium pascui TaxID=46609 RepID=UPI00195BB49D|nr:rod shape-determining protein MreB [Clostridium pascui]MBM7870770.1 rod shape-determining protein MreB [Clostridium pascui]